MTGKQSFSLNAIAPIILVLTASSVCASSLPVSLNVNFGSCVGGNDGTTLSETTTVAPLNYTFSCQPYASAAGSVASGTLSASYGTLGSKITVTGGGNNPSGGSPAVGSDSYFEDNLQIGGLSAGTPVALTFVFAYSGTWSYNLPDYLTTPESISVNPNISVNNGQGIILDTLNTLTFCDANTSSGFPCDTNAISCSSSDQLCSPSPTFSDMLYSDVVDTTSGATLGAVVQFVTLVGGVYGGVSEGSTVTSDFLDPASLYFEATDPNTGIPLQGVTVIGTSGTDYVVNPVSSIPEPSIWGALLLLSAGCVFAKTALKRRRKSAVI